MEQTKRFKVALLALVAALALCLGMTTTAFAAEDDAQAAVTKELQVGEGTTVPDMTFTFGFQKILSGKTIPDDNGISLDLRTDGPAIADKTATVKASSLHKTDGTTVSYFAETANVIAGLEFPAAGVYAYTVTEKSNAANPATWTKDALYDEEVTYSDKSYTMYVWVTNTTDDDGNIVPVPSDITFVDDDDEDKTKIDGTPGGSDEGGIDADGDPETGNANGSDVSGVFFTNTYAKSKTGPIDPNDPDTFALDVNKTVKGDLADALYQFGFTLNVTAPDVDAASKTTFKVAKVKADGTIDTAFTPVTATYGQDYTFTLAHGEKLLLGDVYIGSTYDVKETAVTGYTTTSQITTNGTAVAGVVANTAQTITDGANAAAYLNTFQDVTPTGIIMNNLPFFMLILVAVGALVAFVVVKSKKAHTTL